MRLVGLSVLILLAVTPGAWPTDHPASHAHLFFRVSLDSHFEHPVSGRLLIFAAAGKGKKEVDQNPFQPEGTAVAAQEIEDLAPGASVDVDTDALAYPAGFSHLTPGDYEAQAVLDVDHTYNYLGRTAPDLISAVTPLSPFPAVGGEAPTLLLNAAIPVEPAEPLASTIHVEEFTSPQLSAFFHRHVAMRALVVEPPEYAAHPADHYPAAYYTHGFGGSLDRLHRTANHFDKAMRGGQQPGMFWILLDESCATGTHEFADSANNGPWGSALTKEFIPYLESKYRLDRRADARFLNGHSSGGWATLWLQVTYPKIFGGTWSTSPDPSDFHDWSGVDLYAPHANVYQRADGTPYPIVRDGDRVQESVQQFAQTERVMGSYGGQFSSFEYVFSPRGADGLPLPMFDRNTGEVHPDVVEAWQRYDIVRTIDAHWRQLRPDLDGKIHVYVGTKDTFYLDGAAHRLDAELKKLGAHAQVTFLEGRSHMNVYVVGADHNGLYDQIAKEMYAHWQSTAKKG